jgi:hypothetical protein
MKRKDIEDSTTSHPPPPHPTCNDHPHPTRNDHPPYDFSEETHLQSRGVLGGQVHIGGDGGHGGALLARVGARGGVGVRSRAADTWSRLVWVWGGVARPG